MINVFKGMDRKSCILIFFICFLFGTICYIDTNRLIYIMNSDTVSEMNYMQRVWETKNLLPEGWFHSQELLFSRPVFISSLIYGITKKLLFSYKLSLILCCILFIYMFYIYCKSIGFSFQTRLLSILMFLSIFPFSMNSTEPSILGVLFIDKYSYIVFVLIILGTLTIRNRIQIDNKTYGYLKFQQLIAIVCACYIGMSGVKELMFFYFPWVVLELFNSINFYEMKINTTKALKFSIYNFFSNLLGIIAMITIIAPKINFIDRNNYNITATTKLLESFVVQIACILRTSGLEGGYSIKSLYGLSYLTCFIIFAVITWYFINVVLANKNNLNIKNDIHLFNLRFWAISSFFTFFYLTIIDSLGVSRYYTCYYFLCSLICASLYEYALQNSKKIQKILFKFICSFIVVQWICWYMPLVFDTEYSPKYNHDKIILANTLVNDGYEMVYASFWNAGILKGISNGKLETAHLTGGLQPFEWLIDSNNFRKFDKAVLVLDDDQVEWLKKNNSTKNIVSPKRFIKKIEEFNVFKFSQGDIGISTSTFPQKVNKIREISLPNVSMNVSEETVVETNCVKTNRLKKEKYILYGPYVDILSGTYNISIYYDSNSENATVGYFDIAAFDGTKILKRETLKTGNNEICTLNNVKFNKDKRVEIRVYQYKDTDLILKKIEIEKVQ